MTSFEATDSNNDIFKTLLDIPIPNQFIVNEFGQDCISNLTWNDIFNHIKSEHWHQCDKFTCPHSESLYEHLLVCANICYQRAKSLGYSEKECIKAYLTGLLHDIGKPGTRRLQGKYVSFKGHGLVGGALLENFYTPELCDAFDLSKDDWADISTCADVHMCSYFPQQTSILHKYSVNILPLCTKKMLTVLRVGDQLSMTPHQSYEKNSEQIRVDVESGYDVYNKTLFEEIPFESLNKQKGVLILVQGGSSSGKSTFCRELINQLGKEKCDHINRDLYMIQWTQKMNGIPFDSTIDQITPELYQSCHKKYIDSGKRWAPQMNKAMMTDIHDGLQEGKIVIVDTLATMFDSIEFIIPEIAQNSYRISFWLHRNELVTESESKNRLGMDLPSQLKVHGETTLYNPFNKNIDWTKMISATEGDEDSPYRAHISISLGWTNIKQPIISHLCEKILDIYTFNQNTPRVPVLHQTNDMTLIELVQKLKDLDAIEEFFPMYFYTLSKYVPGAIGIKYIDGINQIWRPKWAREARGRFYYIGSDHNVIPLKDTLQRGIEILTKAHLDAGIDETQDVSIKTKDHLDDIQQSLLKTFSAVNPIDSYLTGKVDGSLLIVNIYTFESEQYEIIKTLGLAHGDDFAKTIINHCVNNNLSIVSIASQGTLFIGSEMQDYFLTSIQNLMDTVVTSTDDWVTLAPKFVSKVLDYYNSIGLGNHAMVNMCFESYCKDRLTFNGKLHSELAVGYDHNGLNLLGLMNKGVYIPHFDLPRHTFNQPFYYRINNTQDVYRLMGELDEVVMGSRSKEQFLNNFLIDQFTSKVIHPEGFVLLTPINGTYDYAKIKTQLYYKCHKVRQSKIKELLQLPQPCSIYYPILKNLHKFFDDMDIKLKTLVSRAYQRLLNNINKESVFYLKQNSKAQVRMDDVIDNIIPITDWNVLDIQQAKKIEVIFKMMLNNKDNYCDINAIFSEITQDLYDTNTDEIVEFTRNLIMKVEPWKSNWENRLLSLIGTFDEAVDVLYNIVMKDHN